jgi:cation:H+ antiporter
MLGISVYLLIISLDSTVSRFEGATLLVGVILYTLFNYRVSVGKNRLQANNPGSSVESEAEIEDIGVIESKAKQIALIIAGIAGVVIGAQVLINAAVEIMKVFGASEKFIGLTIVAVGTSLPELATSIVAALRKEMDISIGNLVGSNVFNILCVIGAAGLVRPIVIPGGFFASGLIYDYLMMMLTSSLPLVIMAKDFTIGRGGGLLLLGCYVSYMAYLVCSM